MQTNGDDDDSWYHEYGHTAILFGQEWVDNMRARDLDRAGAMGTYLGVLEERCKAAEREKEALEERCKAAEKEKEVLEKLCEALKERSKAVERLALALAASH